MQTSDDKSSVFLTDEWVSGKEKPLITFGDFWGENAQFSISGVKR